MISIPIKPEVKAEISENEIKVSGKLGENTRKFNDLLINVKIDNNNIIIDSNKIKKLEKKAKKIEQTMATQIINDMNGVSKYYEIEMQVVSAHFPITAERIEDMFFIKNIIGERAKRSTKIIKNTKVEINNQKIKIYGINLDDVCQTAANIRKLCKIREKDSRVFQDGIYYAIE